MNEKKSPIIIFTYLKNKIQKKYFHSLRNMLIDRTSKKERKKYLWSMTMMMKHKIHFHFYHWHWHRACYIYVDFETCFYIVLCVLKLQVNISFLQQKKTDHFRGLWLNLWLYIHTTLISALIIVSALSELTVI